MADHLDVRRGVYHDSVSLLQVSRRVADVDGVDKALVAMATELNLDVLASMGFAVPDAGPNDLLVAIRTDDDAVLEAARAEVDAALAASQGTGSAGFGDAPPPRTVAAAVRAGDVDLALVSVPGEHAFVEAMDAVRAGVSVMVFSDNVPVEQEVALKTAAAEQGVLVMGPDAGTAIVSGVGLGFANVVRPGPVGIVAASGTGAQQLTCLLDDAGIGTSHVLGVGGRDLSAAVGGRSTQQAMAALDADPATEVVVVLSKPADPTVAAEVRRVAEHLDTPVVFALLGPDAPDLTAAAAEVATALGREAGEPAQWPAPTDRPGPYTELRGLFAGGTLRDEAMVIAAAALEAPVRSNIPLADDLALTDGLDTPGHVFVDLGEDEFTLGRPHPMIDQRLRLERLAAEAARPGGRVVLLDVVLGHGAHPDPAAELAPAIADAIASGEDLAVVVSLCGTVGDPQDRDRQAAALVEAGASVHLSNAAAARTAVQLAGGRA
ncbi:FdrA family protein [Egicoccus halophilus]|uniref:Fatty-acid metabolism regulator protein n=1 Tax=Egicoccus halophilus TaxID=1670830 RepID=A0A8J3A8J6_9ACTN|nr:FdrA family protein [Egicoccus halophilus]GGI04244.1 fatty-acid metabolism regulator protein [Egicoccus halophilus]